MPRACRNLLYVFLGCILIKISTEYCYQLKMLGFKTTDSEDYKFVMYLHPNQTLSSVTRVFNEIPIPAWNLVLAIHQQKPKTPTAKLEPPKILYNATYIVCELWKYVKRIRIFNNVAETILKEEGGNMSLTCPMAVGTYILQNMRIPPDTGILRYMYSKNSLYTLYGKVYSLHKRDKKRMDLKASYEINATVVKLC